MLCIHYFPIKRKKLLGRPNTNIHNLLLEEYRASTFIIFIDSEGE